jgi:ribosomal protein L13
MYETLKLLEDKGLFKTLIKQGVLSITIAGHKMIYETYLREKSKTGSNSQAITNTSIETKTPERTIYKVIKKMRG